MMNLVSCVRDQNLKLTLSFGIGLHHAGLHEKDRAIAEELFENQKIQVASKITVFNVYNVFPVKRTRGGNFQ